MKTEHSLLSLVLYKFGNFCSCILRSTKEREVPHHLEESARQPGRERAAASVGPEHSREQTEKSGQTDINLWDVKTT